MSFSSVATSLRHAADDADLRQSQEPGPYTTDLGLALVQGRAVPPLMHFAE